MEIPTTDEPNHKSTSNETEPKQKSPSENQIDVDEIRRGFPTRKYYADRPKSKKFKGFFWDNNVLQVFTSEDNQPVKNVYYCALCGEMIIAVAGNGTAKLNRHARDHTLAKERIERQQIAELVVESIKLGMKYGKDVATDYIMRILPKPKSGPW